MENVTKSIITFPKRYPVLAFFILTLIIGWSPLLTSRGGFMAFGMSIAGLILTLMLDGWKGVLETLKRAVQWRAHIFWYGTALFLPGLVYLASLGIQILLGGDHPDWVFSHSPWWGFPLLFLSLIFPMEGPLGEEVFGLRGYALPKLQESFGPVYASLIVGTFFGGWHLPEFFREGSSQYQLGMPFFFPFVCGEIAWSIVMTWLYNRTKGSVLISGILFHAAFNFWACTLLAGISYTRLEAPPALNIQLYGIAEALKVLTAILVLAMTRGNLGYPATKIKLTASQSKAEQMPEGT
jgi:membrane protease YdiL (CAAX protease family)